MPMFFRRNRTTKIVNSLTKALTDLPDGGSNYAKSVAATSKYVMKTHKIFSEASKSSSKTALAKKLMRKMFMSNAILLMFQQLLHIEFEVRKTVGLIVSYLLDRDGNWEYTSRMYKPMEFHLQRNPLILTAILKTSENEQLTWFCGGIFRTCIERASLADIFFQSGEIFRVFDYCGHAAFQVMAETFITLERILTLHDSAEEFLEKNYDRVLPIFNGLLTSDNYGEYLNCVKVLRHILVTPRLHNFYERITDCGETLSALVALFLGTSRNVKFETYRVITIFILKNPMTEEIKVILRNNKEKLLFNIEIVHDHYRSFETGEDDVYAFFYGYQNPAARQNVLTHLAEIFGDTPLSSSVSSLSSLSTSSSSPTTSSYCPSTSNPSSPSLNFPSHDDDSEASN